MRGGGGSRRSRHNSSSTSSCAGVILVTGERAGLGNRLSRLGGAALLALLTRRVLVVPRAGLLRSAYVVTGPAAAIPLLHTHPFLPCLDGSLALLTADFAADPAWVGQRVWHAGGYDWMGHALSLNPSLAPSIAALFPTGDVFRDLVGGVLLGVPTPRWAARVAAARAALLPRAADAGGVTAAAAAPGAQTTPTPTTTTMIGLQLRTAILRQRVPRSRWPDVGVWCRLGLALARSRGAPPARVTWFVATDAPSGLRRVAACLPPGSHVVATPKDLTARDAAHNPGSEEAALLDLALLAGCDELVVTAASSFGSVASALGGVAPWYVVAAPQGSGGRRGASGTHPLAPPAYFRAPSTEPCAWALGWGPAAQALAAQLARAGGDAARAVRARIEGHPLYDFHRQCV